MIQSIRTIKFSIGMLIALVVLLFSSYALQAQEALQMTTPVPKSTLSSNTLNLSWNDVEANTYDVAVGSAVAMPDYGWRQDLTGTSATFSDLPTDGSTVYIRIFAHFDTYTDELDTNVVAFGGSVEIPESSSDPVQTESIDGPRGFLSLSPAEGAVLSGSSVTFQWNHEESNTMDIAVGSSLGSPNYAWISGKTGSVTVNNLPTDGSPVYVRFFPGGDGNPEVDVVYTAATLDQSAPVVVPSEPDPTPVTNDTEQPVPSTPAPITPFPVQTSPTLPTSPVWSAGSLSSIWANSGEDKVTQGEVRGSTQNNISNAVWNGEHITISGAKNEVVAFNLILEAEDTSAKNISVSFESLIGPEGSTIATTNFKNVFDWTQRNIELFFVKYLEIKGLSELSYQTYDERHIPERLRRPYDTNGIGSGSWTDRPDHNAMYPDIAVPLELHPTFDVEKGKNQSIWADIYIPKDVSAGDFVGNVVVRENNVVITTIPVQLTVHNFTLADDPAADTMLFVSRENIFERYLGDPWISGGQPLWNTAVDIEDTHFQLAHRHKISLIDSDGTSNNNAPSAAWLPRLDGSLFTSTRGYNGPGVGIGNGVYSIGTYGSWGWKGQGESSMHENTTAWEQWFQTNSPSTERFLYLIDEPGNLTEVNTWTSWMNSNDGVGNKLMSFATIPMNESVPNAPELDIHASWANIGETSAWETALNTLLGKSDKRAYMYNAIRPGVGSFATEDDGVALRQLAWAQYKKNIDRWFFWESTYYNNTQGGEGQTNVFTEAQTFGSNGGFNASEGETGWNYSNGDGVLFYPGTDTLFPSESYGIAGPIASLRLKHWRRGIQDVDYLTLAAERDPEKTKHIVDTMIPKVLWEYGVDDPQDPTWVRTDISWSTDPDVWEATKKELVAIILGAESNPENTPVEVPTSDPEIPEEIVDEVEPEPVVEPIEEEIIEPPVVLLYEHGTLIKYAGSRAVYQLQPDPTNESVQLKHPIKNAKTFRSLGLRWKDIVVVSDDIVYETGDMITFKNMSETIYRKNGTLIKYKNNRKVYQLYADPNDPTAQVKRHIVNVRTFKSLGFKWKDIVIITDAEIYKTGKPIAI